MRGFLMIKRLFIFCLFLTGALLIFNCASKNKKPTQVPITPTAPEKILDGIFKAEYPDLEGAGVEISIIFRTDKTVEKTSLYVDRENFPVIDTGIWSINSAGYIRAQFNNNRIELYRALSPDSILFEGSNKNKKETLLNRYVLKRAVTKH